MDGSDVILLNLWVSVFGARVRIALAEKGINYEYREEDINNKSPLLLQMNPVHKTIPVLIHHAKPICESSIIVQYIDEAWHDKAPQLLPSDPYIRAQARFWADFIDKKAQYSITHTISLETTEPALLHLLTRLVSNKINLFDKSIQYHYHVDNTKITNKDQEVAKGEFMDVLKVLEGQLGEKPYLVGESFGFADIALIPFSVWFYTLNKIGNMNIDKECPKLAAWVNRCMERESVSKTLSDPHQFYDLVLEHNRKGY